MGRATIALMACLASCTAPPSSEQSVAIMTTAPAAVASPPTDPYATERSRMVDEQIAGRGIRDPAVLAAVANGSPGANVRRHARRAVDGPSALRREARLVGANERADVVGHAEQLAPLLLVVGDREAAEGDTPPVSLTVSDTPRLAVRLSCAFSARRRSSSAVTSSSGMRQG